MTPYIFMYGFLASLLLFKPDRKLFFLTFVPLCLFLNLAYTNGIDWTAYQFLYENEPFHTRGIEFGYTGLVLIGKFLGLNFEFFKFIILSFNLYIILKFIFRVSIKPAFVVLVLFQTHLLGNFFEPAIRQLQAVVIFIYSIEYLVNKNNKKFIISVILGSLFHQSMLVLIFLPWLIYKINFKRVIILSLIGSALSPMFDVLMRLLVVFPMFKDYSFYLGSSYFEGIEPSLFNLSKALIYMLPMLILSKYRQSEDNINVLRGLGLLFVLCFNLQFSLLIFYRFNHYFIIFYVVYISFIFDIYRKSIFRYLFFCFYIFIHFISLIKGVEYFRDRDSMKYFPYTNYFYEYVVGRTYENPQDKIDARLNSRWSQMDVN